VFLFLRSGSKDGTSSFWELVTFPRHTHKKNTRKMNRVKKKVQGRPRRSDTELNLRVIGERIRELRGSRTQEDFAKLMAVSQAQLSKYELGQSAPPLGFLTRAAKDSGKSVDWILVGKG
jgi:DNA-binding transcriptional regulator YiaG